MAGRWLKIEKITPDKTEIVGIAAKLKISRGDALLGCFRVWCWFDDHTLNGRCRDMTMAMVDSIAGFELFSEAMREMGWLKSHGARGVSLPEFLKHNRETAKQQALTNIRVALHRKRKSNAVGNAERNAKKVTTRTRPDQTEQIPPTPNQEASAASLEPPSALPAAGAVGFEKSADEEGAARRVLARLEVREPAASQLVAAPGVTADRIVREYLSIQGKPTNAVGVLISRLRDGADGPSVKLTPKALGDAIRAGLVEGVNGQPVAGRKITQNSLGIYVDDVLAVRAVEIESVRLS